MGCTQSKIEDEESVIRCKERKHFMKEAVAFRNAFAAAHSAYTVAVKNIGAALSDYAQGEVQNPHHVSPSLSAPVAAAAAQGPYEAVRPPPPLPPLTPLDSPLRSPLHRAASAPVMKIPKEETRPVEPTIQEDDVEGEPSGSLRQRSSSRIRTQQHSAKSRTPFTPSNQYCDYIFQTEENMAGSSLGEEVEEKIYDEASPKVEGRADMSTSPPVEKLGEAPLPRTAAVAPPAVAGKFLNRGKMGAEGKRAPRNVNLAQLFVEIDDHFLKASEGAHEVSKMLEATRLHYHSNFADNRGHIDHSARVMQVITWNRSFRGLENAVDVKDNFDSEENETHATVLDKLLAWEKKLYDEVKGGEHLKIEYQKKVASLNRQKKRSPSSESLERIKAAVSYLHTRYIVDMQSMDSTVSEINRLRDEQLYPKLVQLVDGMARMWEIMEDRHHAQLKIALELKYLDTSQSLRETSEQHYNRTIQLFNIVGEWHLQFSLLVDNQRKYIKALNNWLRLNLIPIESSLKEKVSSPPPAQSPPIQKLLLEWQDSLEKLPNEPAQTAIYNFRAIIDTLMNLQQDEMKQRMRCDETRKELTRKEQSFEDWRRKLMERRTTTDEGEAVDERHMSALAERELAVEMLRKRLEEEQEDYERACLQVREKSLASFRSHMPELFTTMARFAADCSNVYNNLSQLGPKVAVNGEKPLME
ncbi:hypothetical protein SAY87_002118 [Trapa incisa]|uniref:Uncharacterized protein n=1 Tax=Trapa incisa TaxID=236973 RepID=A0AAN7JTU0_9MYRT|nr:hypothetical protein SAY87_002118 [Trapa incisa]